MTLISDYRPARIDGLAGAANLPVVKALRNHVASREKLTAVLHGKYGTGKTSLARNVVRGYVCQKWQDGTPEGCGTCPSCKGCEQQFSGGYGGFLHFEIDGRNPPTLLEFRDHINEWRDLSATMIVDECQKLPSEYLDALHVSAGERPDGVLILVMTLSEGEIQRYVPPDLDDRLRTYAVFPAQPSEIADYLAEKMVEWKINAQPGQVARLAAKARSFRKLLRALEDVQAHHGARIDAATVEALFPTDVTTQKRFPEANY